MNDLKVIHFMRYRKIAMVVSAILMLISAIALTKNGLVFGLDFTGGTSIELSYEKNANIGQIRSQLETAGYEGAVVQNFGADTDVVIRLQGENSKDLAQNILSVLSSTENKATLKQVEFVGPQVGNELKEQSGLGFLLALGAIMVYVAMQFQFKFSVAAVLGLLHTTLITLGAFAIFGWEFNLIVLAALLAMLGYSLNDTIIVADRIRENFRMLRKGEPEEIIDISITQTLSRTLVTSMTTLFVLLVLLYFGGDIIFGFCMMLIIGIVVGTYESIYICSNILLMMKVSKEDLLVKSKEDTHYDTP